MSLILALALGSPEVTATVSTGVEAVLTQEDVGAKPPDKTKGSDQGAPAKEVQGRAAPTAPPSAPGPSGPTPGSPTEPTSLPWKLDTEHRFVWIKSSQKVGETRFRIQRIAQEGRLVYRLSAARTYAHEGIAHEGLETTTFLPDGTPLRFEEKLRVSTLKDLRARQETTVEVKSGKAFVRYVPNERPDMALSQEMEMPPGTFLFANQAVEHWVILVSRLPQRFESHESKVLYPDFGKIFTLTFRKVREELMEIKGQRVETTVYSFRSPLDEFAGSIWKAPDGRLIQIEFPNAKLKQLTLKVLLSPED